MQMTGAARLAEHSMLAPRLYTALNGRFLAGAEAIFAPRAVLIDVPSGRVYAGQGSARRYLASWPAAFTDWEIEVLTVHPSVFGATVERLFRGTHSGPLDTMAGRVEPTFSRVELYVCDVIDFSDGWITGLRTYYDAATLMAQLGLPRLAHPPFEVPEA